MNRLLDKIRKARESKLKIGSITYKVMRPTDLDTIDMRFENTREAVLGVSKFVVDWDAKEVDLFPGGSGSNAEFDTEVFVEYIKDHPESWAPLIEGIRDLYSRYNEQRKEREKK